MLYNGNSSSSTSAHTANAFNGFYEKITFTHFSHRFVPCSARSPVRPFYIRNFDGNEEANKGEKN